MAEAGKSGRRRRFGRRALLLGGGGVAALAAGAGGGLLFPFAPARGRKHLTATESAAALALAQTLFPGGDEGPGAEEAEVLGRLDEMVGEMHPETARLVKAGLRALEYATLPAFLSRFSALGPDARRAAVLGWERGRPAARRAALISLRFQVAMAYFESQVARDACGWTLGCTPSGSAG